MHSSPPPGIGRTTDRGATGVLGGWLLVALITLAWGLAAAAPAEIMVTQISVSGDTTEVAIRFACPNRLMSYSPMTASASSEIALMRMDRCADGGDAISEATRPAGREMAALDEIEYRSRSGTDAILQLRFDRPVTVTVDQTGDLRSLRLFVKVPAGSVPQAKAAPPRPAAAAAAAAPAVRSPEQIARAEARARAATQAQPVVAAAAPLYVVNLRSTTKPRAPGAEDAGVAQGGQILYMTQATVDGRVWHRLRLGFFATEDEAHAAWLGLRSRYPDSWVTRASSAERAAAPAGSMLANTGTTLATAAAAGQGPATLSDAEVTALLKQARGSMIDKDYAQAIELATRVLNEPPGSETANARELLGIAHQRNGDVAQAIAEYRRYLDDYPDGSDAARVSQRLAALTTVEEQPRRIVEEQPASVIQASSWETAGSFSQYFLSNSSDLGGEGGTSTQSVALTGADFLARYRGQRFNFSTRATGAYRYNIDGPSWSVGSQSRFYNLYVDLEDQQSGFSGRLGRQRMRTDGILGLFDGLHLSWQMQPDIRLNFNAGFPVYSSAEDFSTDRTLYGISADFTNLLGMLEANTFFNIQTIDGIEDRQALGGQLRYVDERYALIGAIDYDIGFNKIVSFNLLGNRSFDSGLTISASADYRREPLLTTQNALIGQQASAIDELRQSLTEEQIRDLALDRSGEMLTYFIGVSRPLAERWEVNGDFTFSQTARGPGSGGVLMLPDSGDEYYVYASLVGSSLFREGDVSILGVRYGDTYAASIASVYLDTRFPVTHGLRLNPRLEISQREIKADNSSELLLIPSLRLLYRFADHYEIEFEGGGESGSRTGGVVDTDTMNYYLYLGCRADF